MTRRRATLPRTSAPRTALPWLLLWAVACGQSDAVDDRPGPGPDGSVLSDGGTDATPEQDAMPNSASVRLGVGAEEFVELEDGGDLELILGPQGGYMVPLALRATDVVPGDPEDFEDPSNPEVTYRAERKDNGDLLGVVADRRGLVAVDGGELEMIGTWLIIDQDIDPAEYLGSEIQISVSLVDAHQANPKDEVTVTARAYEDP